MDAGDTSDAKHRREPIQQQRRLIFWALMIIFLLSALDQTIVSTALPRIVQELKGLDVYSWVTTIYLLTSTVMVPIWGKLGDLYGRKLILLVGTGTFVVSSWLCGLAGVFGDLPILGSGMTQLIVFRGIQGVGGGALFTTTFAIIADLYPPRERGKYAGLFGAVYGLASIVGPILGGWLTDHGTTDFHGVHIAGWRWVFYLNLPTSSLAFFMIAAKMPDAGGRRGGKVDYVGAALIITAIGALMLALSLGPRQGWTSNEVLGLSSLSLLTQLAFVYAETRSRDPILPLSIFKVRAFSTSIVSSFTTSMAFAGTIVFLPLYLQLALGIKATSSGLTLLPLLAGLIVGSTVAGRLVTRTGHYKSLLLVGATMQFLGVFLLWQLTAESSQLDIMWRLFLFGLGPGPAQTLFNIVAQSSVSPTQIGVATSTSTFLRQMGSLVGVAIFGVIMTADLQRSSSLGGQLDFEKLQAFTMRSPTSPAGLLPAAPFVAHSIAEAMKDIFAGAMVIVAIAFVTILFIPRIPLRSMAAPANIPPEPGAARQPAKSTTG